MGAAEAFILMFWLAVPILFFVGIYWVVRLGVRHGMGDARKDSAPQAPQALPQRTPEPI